MDPKLLICQIWERKKKGEFFNIVLPPLVDTSRSLTVPGLKEQKWIPKGFINESLPNSMFRVYLYNEDLILSYVSEKIRRRFIWIPPKSQIWSKSLWFNQRAYNLSTSQRNKNSKDSFFNFNKHVFHGNTIRDAKYQETFFLPRKK